MRSIDIQTIDNGWLVTGQVYSSPNTVKTSMCRAYNKMEDLQAALPELLSVDKPPAPAPETDTVNPPAPGT